MRREAWELGITSAISIGLVTFFGRFSSHFWELDMWTKDGMGYTMAVFLTGWIFGLVCAFFIWE